MSDKKEKTTAEVVEKKKDAGKKKENPLKKIGPAIKKFFKDFKGECKKVTWPSGKTVLNNSLVVIVVVAIVGIAILAVDQGLAAIIDALVGLASKEEVTETTKAANMISLFLMK